MNYASNTAAIKQARNLTRQTGQRHVVRPFAMGNKIAYTVVSVERFSA